MERDGALFTIWINILSRIHALTANHFVEEKTFEWLKCVTGGIRVPKSV